MAAAGEEELERGGASGLVQAWFPRWPGGVGLFSLEQIFIVIYTLVLSNGEEDPEWLKASSPFSCVNPRLQ